MRHRKSKPAYNAFASLALIFRVSADYHLELTPEKASERPDNLQQLDAGKAEQGLVCDGSPLDDMDADIIAMFRLLPKEEREGVFDIIHLKYKRRKRNVEKKRESIYWTYFDGSANEQSAPARGHE